MPERLGKWKLAARQFGGTAEAKTHLASSTFRLSAEVDGVLVRGSGRSVPYSDVGGESRFTARVRRPLGATVRVTKEARHGGLAKLVLGRDVIIGAAGFDSQWYIRSHNPAIAQAWLGPGARRAIGAVGGRPEDAWRPDRPSFEFALEHSLRRESVVARIRSFEDDVDQLIDVIQAVADLAMQGERLRQQWGDLASEFGASLSWVGGRAWTFDGKTGFQTSLSSHKVSIAPVRRRLRRRNSRLVTRIAAERAGRGPRWTIAAQDAQGYDVGWRADELPSLTGVQAHAGYRAALLCEEEARDVFREPIVAAFREAAPVAIEVREREVRVELDGSVTDATRVRAAAAVVTAIASRGAPTSSPYR